jgi:uncharacterized protein involved in exopolysaccharide biosynthesis
MSSVTDFDIPGGIVLLWRGRYRIVAITMIAGVLGLLYSLYATPVYLADTIIAPKENKSSSGGMPFLSQMGSLGGLGVQFGLGNASLDRLEYMARSRDLAERVILDFDLLPKMFPKRWNVSAKAWKAGMRPDMWEATESLREHRIAITPNSKKGVLILTFKAPDSTFSAQLANYYLVTLNKKIREDVLKEADNNRRFLEGQLAETADPLLREKIQNLIGMEIEKSMLVSTKSFDILQTPVVPRIRSAPKRKMMVALSLLAGMAIGFMFVLAGKGMRTQFERIRDVAAGLP